MALRTVAVPPELEPVFAQAESVVARFFGTLSRQSERGTIEIAGERYVLVRAASLSVEFFQLVGDLFGEGRGEDADEFARNILFDLSHAIGRADARKFAARTGMSEPIERLSAGPVHFAHTGWAFVEIDPASRPVASDDFVLFYAHPYSFESDAWLHGGHQRSTPACIMNAGYSSGWCQECFDTPLVATEVQCRACGDDACRFVMAPPHRIEDYLASHRAAALRSGRGRQPIPDLFARKRHEEELRRAQGELERRVHERTSALHDANVRLRREIAERSAIEQQLRQAHKLEAIGRLAGGVAHDFNTLLGVILGNANLLAHSARDPDQRALVDAIVEASQQAAGLTRQLVAFSRAAPRGEPVSDVNALVDQTMRLLGRMLGGGIEVSVTKDERVSGSTIDRGPFEQVLMNLVINARDAMPRGGCLEVATRLLVLESDDSAALGVVAGAYVELVVRDTGQGMSEEVVSRIFEPYFSTKEAPSGTGLGLSTVYGFVKNADGAVSVHSVLGQGTTFRVVLPAVGLEGLGREGACPRGGETVLVVSERADELEEIVRALAGGGYVPLEAASAEEALALSANSRKVDLLLVPMVLSTGGGPQLALRMLADRPRMRVLYVFEPGAHVVSPTTSDTAVLARPFTDEALLGRLRAVLDESTGPSSNR